MPNAKSSIGLMLAVSFFLFGCGEATVETVKAIENRVSEEDHQTQIEEDVSEALQTGSDTLFKLEDSEKESTISESETVSELETESQSDSSLSLSRI